MMGMTGRAVPIAAAAVLTGATTVACVMAARRSLLQTERSLVPGYPDAVARAPARGMWAYFPQLAFGLFLLIVLLSPAGIEAQILALVGAAGAYVLGGTWLAAESAPWAYGTRRLEREKEHAVAEALGGHIHRVWVAPYPMVSGPVGTVATIAGRSLFIWNPIARLRPEEIAAGAVFRAARRRAWPIGIIALWAARMLEELKGVAISRWPMWALLGFSLLAAIAGEGRWLLARRRFASDEAGARAAITGILAVGREQARLAATGSLPSAGAIRLPSVAEMLWRRAVDQASRVAAVVKLDPATLTDAIHEVVAREGVMPAAGGPPPLPEIAAEP
jgi:hypothetical protein